jgi:serine/threonine protein kinase
MHFRFGKKIGSGGFGIVSHATRSEDGLPFAVKHLNTEFLADEEAVKRFRREVRLQRGLEHPNILPIVGANLSVSPPWFVMPVAERTLLEEGQSGLSEERIDELFRGLIAGLLHAHAHDVIHRDLKPENIMLTHDGVPQIADFGLGKTLEGDSTAITKTTMGMGSFPYVAPEQMTDARNVDARADIFALGKVLQFLVTNGRLPVAPPNASIPAKYRYFISKCCEWEPADRYQDMGEVSAAFDQVVHGNEHPEPAREVAEELLRRFDANGDDRALADFLELLEHNTDDLSLYRKLVPRMSARALNSALARHPKDLQRVVEVYDGDLEDHNLDFDYCDVVADFYQRLYAGTDDLGLRRLMLRRLIKLGCSHNRYHVGDVVAGMLVRAQETSEVMMVADVLRDNPDDASWFRVNPGLREAELAPLIDEALWGKSSSESPPS